ncbi:MAG: hypothetical protein HC831_31460 [Chloroflexia bacterium]|nr:hypothetical protein [Chloroflexia bacterium]
MVGPDVWRDSGAVRVNREFEEDSGLFRNWKDVAAREGLKVRAGRWKIPGKPIALLIDFTPFYLEKK